MYLSELIANTENTHCDNDKLEITGITPDSRLVQKGFLFAALKGNKLDGTQFINKAVEVGAVAILTDSKDIVNLPEGVAHIAATNPRKALAQLAAAFYPNHVRNVVAVTGTNGKSSTVTFCRQLWELLGEKGASYGTIGISAPGINIEGTLTTPDPVTMHKEIQNLANAGVEYLAIEASSQGLDQYRPDGLHIKAAGFTNLTQDHLDYHGTMENYLECKLRLISEVLEDDAVVVINADVPYSKNFELAAKARHFRVIDYGYKAKSIKVLSHENRAHGQFVEVEVFNKTYHVEIPLVGKFQMYNALCALGLVVSQNINDEDFVAQAVSNLEKLQTVRGRLEHAATLPNGAVVYVDYAHTPDGIETVLRSIRPHVNNQLHIVFGCGGDRDRTKRPKMGKLAVELADSAIVTDDNPRTEDPQFIRNQVMEGAIGATEIKTGRADAIRYAVKNLQAGDILVVAGKGHEQGQEINGVKTHFDDVEEVKKAVEALQ